MWAFRRQLVSLRRRHDIMTAVEGDRYQRAEHRAVSTYETEQGEGRGIAWERHSLAMVRVVDTDQTSYQGSYRSLSRDSTAGSRVDTIASAHESEYIRSGGSGDSNAMSGGYHSGRDVRRESSGWRGAGRPAAALSASGGAGYSRLSASSPSPTSRSSGNTGLHAGRSSGGASSAQGLRRRRALVLLGTSALLAMLLSLVPGLGFMLVLGLLFLVFVVVYVAMLARARRSAAARRRMASRARRMSVGLGRYGYERSQGVGNVPGEFGSPVYGEYQRLVAARERSAYRVDQPGGRAELPAGTEPDGIAYGSGYATRLDREPVPSGGECYSNERYSGDPYATDRYGGDRHAPRRVASR